jgi:hypothetical protein
MVFFRLLRQDAGRMWEQGTSPEFPLKRRWIMKKHAATILVLTLMALPGLANAQIRKVIRANVPFEFIANGKNMPAGPCTITASGDGQTVLSISSGKKHVFVLPNATQSSKPYGDTALVFHQYGQRYFLSSIRREGDDRGYGLPAGKAELELRAQKVTEGDVTLLAAAR